MNTSRLKCGMASCRGDDCRRLKAHAGNNGVRLFSNIPADTPKKCGLGIHLQ